MTQSGARRQRQIDRRTTAATFVARLARTTDYSRSRIFREVRALGYSIGSDFGRGIINAARGGQVSPRQQAQLTAFSISFEAANTKSLPEELGSAIRAGIDRTLRRTRYTIKVTARGTAKFVWARSGSTEPKQAQVEATQTFNIRADQLDAFNSNVNNLLPVFLGKLEGKAANFIGADPKYGEYFIENPTINIDSVTPNQ